MLSNTHSEFFPHIILKSGLSHALLTSKTEQTNSVVLLHKLFKDKKVENFESVLWKWNIWIQYLTISCIFSVFQHSKGSGSYCEGWRCNPSNHWDSWGEDSRGPFFGWTGLRSTEQNSTKSVEKRPSSCHQQGLEMMQTFIWIMWIYILMWLFFDNAGSVGWHYCLRHNDCGSQSWDSCLCNRRHWRST